MTAFVLLDVPHLSTTLTLYFSRMRLHILGRTKMDLALFGIPLNTDLADIVTNKLTAQPSTI
jgi:hypothetical protein